VIQDEGSTSPKVQISDAEDSTSYVELPRYVSH
jgi:hypothetical protein